MAGKDTDLDLDGVLANGQKVDYELQLPCDPSLPCAPGNAPAPTEPLLPDFLALGSPAVSVIHSA